MKNLFAIILCVLATSTMFAQTPIGTARGMSAGSTVTIQGTITVDDNFGTITRFIQDASGGIGLYNGGGSLLSGLNVGDVVQVTGTVGAFNNLEQLSPISNVAFQGTSPEPAFVVGNGTALFQESVEAQLVEIQNVTFDNPGTFAGGTNYDITDATGTYQLRINAESDLVGTPIPTSPVNIRGIMGQFQANHQLLPRFTSDIIFPGNPPIVDTDIYQVSNTTFSIDVNFTTQMNGSTIIKYGLTPSLELGTANNDPTLATNHPYTLTGLNAATLYYVQGASVSASGDTSFTSTKLMATQSMSTGRITVFFNRPVNTSVSTGTDAIYTTNPADSIIKYIDEAEQTLDIAIYNVDNNNGIITAINAAITRGVAVRVVANEAVNNDYDMINTINKKKSPTGTSPSGNFYGLMHNKFIVADANHSNPNKSIVFAGSSNWTDAQLNVDPNNYVVIQDQTLARAYEVEFEEMFVGNKFGDQKTDNVPHQFTIGGKEVELFFSPSDNTHDILKTKIAEADYDLYFALLLNTRFDLYNEIADRVQNHGVFAGGIVNDTSSGGDTYLSLLDDLGDQLIIDNQPGIFHHKYMIVDPNDTSSDPFIWTGSHNWSNAARYRNDENTLVIHDATIANMYYQEWTQRYIDNGGNIFVGVSEINEESAWKWLPIFPNPSSTALNIVLTSDEELEQLSYRIVDISGKILTQESLGNTSNFHTQKVDINNLAAGVYFIELYNNVSSQTQKFVKK